WPKPDFEQAPTHPAVQVSWEDAQAFCTWITERERAAGKLGPNERYRLPSDHEWSCAVGLGATEDAAKSPNEKNSEIDGLFPWGTQWPPPKGAGNYAGEELQAALAAGQTRPFDPGAVVIAGYQDDFVHTSPVGSFAANSLGLFDMGGNVLQWCEDLADEDGQDRVLRGQAWSSLYVNIRAVLRSSLRNYVGPNFRADNSGFRIVLETSAPTVAVAATVKLPDPQLPSATNAPAFVNTLGMKFVPVPGTKVRMCIHETRRQDYAVFATENAAAGTAWKNPSHLGVLIQAAEDHPVVAVSWDEAQAFCAWLSKKEGVKYRLPTDREWSFAVGLGPLDGTGLAPVKQGRSPGDFYSWGDSFP
ncbi:MAG: SUMF1/EgtB/PvdO family nonheme iron enzyme, partial [Prosthecobacter sp.]|nr:SUMF1/EgtB/PvdO family nonheme iron enzyme [Prosthecobacter sp.]